MSSVIPTLRYRDAAAAIAFLVDALGFERHAVMEDDNGGIAHAELRHGSGFVMLGSQPPEPTAAWPHEPGGSGTYVVVDDPDALHARAVAAGAEVVMGLTDQDYGSREFAVRDPEGNLWSFGTYVPG